MKTVEVKLYSFDELKPEIQAKVLDRERYFEIEEGVWHEWTVEEQVDRIKTEGVFTEPDIHFSGFSSQGDGACFDCSAIDVRHYLEITGQATKYKEVLDLFIAGELRYVIRKNSYANHYSHQKTRYVDFDIETEITPEQERQINAVCELLESDRYTWSNKIYRELEAEYNYRIQDETVKELILMNEWTFEEDGTMRNE
jgi:hypothetical protein